MIFPKIITGAPPFSEVRNDMAVSIKVMKGSRPLRPAEGFSDQLWTAVEKCWADPNERHTTKTFMDFLPELNSSVKGGCSEAIDSSKSHSPYGSGRSSSSYEENSQVSDFYFCI